MPDDVVALIDFIGRQLSRLSKRLRRKSQAPDDRHQAPREN
jgi:hypothetical protein